MTSDAHPPSGMDDFERGLADLARGPARRHRSGRWRSHRRSRPCSPSGLALRGRRRWPRQRPGSSCGSSRRSFAWWISRPAAREAAELTSDQTAFLNDLARKTWRFFETFVGARRPLAAAGQLPGAPRRRDRAPHVADQHRPRAAGEPGRVRLRLPLGGRTHRPHDANAGHDGATGAVPRPLLQLVRHADAAAAAAAVRLDGGQRQPRRPPAVLARGARRARGCPILSPRAFDGLERRCAL